MNYNDAAALLQRLDAIPGIAGFEEPIGRQLGQELAGCFDEEQTDALGNRLFIRRGKKEEVLLLFAQMDEPGFIVSGFSPSGLVCAQPAGRHAPPPGYPDYTIHSAAGPIPALRCGEGAPLLLDIGARSRRGAENRGAAAGDPISLARPGRLLGKSLYTGRAVESRAGCAALALTLRLLAGAPLPFTVVACAAAQGGLRSRGLRAAAAALRPRLALGFTACSSIPGEEGSPLPGAGPAIRLCGAPPFLCRALAATARCRRIPCQPDASAEGSLDILAFPAGELGIPVRYPHSPAALADAGDILAAGELAAALLQEAEARL